MAKKNKFIGDDEDAEALVITKAEDVDPDAEPDEEDPDAETAEADFDRWAAEQDELDELAKTKRREDAADDERNRILGAIAEFGVDITTSPDDGPPLIERSVAYLSSYLETLKSEQG